MHGANMMLELKQWLDTTFPFWKQRSGKDHIWITAADEGNRVSVNPLAQ